MKEVMCGHTKFYISVQDEHVTIKYGGISHFNKQYSLKLSMNINGQCIKKTFLYVFNVANAYFETEVKGIKDVEMQIEESEDLGEFVGTVNLGNTCYANALLQTLYFLPEMKNYIYNSNGYYAGLLKRLFSNLDSLNKRRQEIVKSINTCESNETSACFQAIGDDTYKNSMCNKEHILKLKEGEYKQAIKSVRENVSGLMKNLSFVESVNTQQDVHEFSKILFDRLENEDKRIKDVIEGELLTTVQCKCGCVSKRRDPFQDATLPLEAHGKQFRCVETSLAAFCQEEELCGYRCETHGNVSATKRTCFERIPDVMFMLVPRFRFDWEKEAYVKDNDIYKFPEKIDFSKYCSSSMCETNDDSTLTLNAFSGNTVNSERVDNTSTIYNLHSVIVHSGVFEEGHFYAYLNLNDKYYKFNDEDVYEASKEEAINWNYGGTYQWNRRLDKRFSAYYLVYRREKPKSHVECNEELVENFIMNKNMVLQTETYNNIVGNDVNDKKHSISSRNI